MRRIVQWCKLISLSHVSSGLNLGWGGPIGDNIGLWGGPVKGYTTNVVQGSLALSNSGCGCIRGQRYPRKGRK